MSACCLLSFFSRGGLIYGEFKYAIVEQYGISFQRLIFLSYTCFLDQTNVWELRLVFKIAWNEGQTSLLPGDILNMVRNDNNLKIQNKENYQNTF